MKRIIARAMCTAVAEALAVGRRSGVDLDKRVERMSAGVVKAPERLTGAQRVPR